MPVPTSLTETQLKTFLVTELGDVGTALGWTTTTPQLVQAVSDAEVLLGVSDVATETNIPRAWAAGRVAIWRAAIRSLGAQFQYSADGQSYSRQQLQAMAKDSLAMAEADLAEQGGGASIKVDRVTYADPYAALPDETLEALF